MSDDSYTEVTSQGWLSRIGGAIKGLFIGLLLFVVAFPVLFWNEGRAVERYKTLEEGGGAVISVSSATVDSANEGKMIHLNGMAVTDDTLLDELFGVSATAIKLKRSVEMYQWTETSNSETKKKLGGGTETVTTYTYSKAWSEQPVISSSFKKPEEHQNPNRMLYSSKQLTAKNVTVGAFRLSPVLIGKLNSYQSLPVSSDENLASELKDKTQLINSTFYIGEDSSAPEIGDYRVSFQSLSPTDVSIIANQISNSFEPYRAKAGGTIELLQEGIFSADAMFQKAQTDNKIMTWILRVVGFVLMFIGLSMFFKPLSVIADVLPILGNIVGIGTGIAAFFITFMLSLITIAIAWVFYRPLLGILLIGVAVGIFFLFRMLAKSRSQKNVSAQQPEQA